MQAALVCLCAAVCQTASLLIGTAHSMTIRAASSGGMIPAAWSIKSCMASAYASAQSDLGTGRTSRISCFKGCHNTRHCFGSQRMGWPSGSLGWPNCSVPMLSVVCATISRMSGSLPPCDWTAPPTSDQTESLESKKQPAHSNRRCYNPPILPVQQKGLPP